MLGDRLDGLHSRLQTYFAGIPHGSVGRGRGTFTTVGTRKVWLWPVLAVLRAQGVLFPVWRHDVPFTVENRPGVVGNRPGVVENRSSPVADAAAGVAVSAIRTFLFAEGPSRMVDAIAAEPVQVVAGRGAVGRGSAGRGSAVSVVAGGAAAPVAVGSTFRLVDHLGTNRRYVADLEAQVDDGALVMRSTAMGVRVGRRRIRLPSEISPRVTLTERFDDESDRQHVSVVLTAPLIGRLYVYEGSFTYAIAVDDAPQSRGATGRNDAQ